jgi:hypothetical protein
MTTTFENAKVGDKVWDFVYGWGEVIELDVSEMFDTIRVSFKPFGYSEKEVIYYTTGSISFNNPQTLFWDEIKFEVPVQPPRMKLVHGVEVPDISFVPKEDEYYYYPSIEMPAFYGFTYFDTTNINDILKNKHGLCYPYTEQGKQAAILHAKAMLGIKE